MKVTDLRRKLAAALMAGGFAMGAAAPAGAAPVFVGDPGFEDHVIDDGSGYAYGAADQAGDPDGFNNPSSAGGGVSPWQALASGGNGIGGDNASWIFNSGYGAINSGNQAAEVQGLYAQNLTATFAAGQSYVATVAASAAGGDDDVVVSLYDAGAVNFQPSSTPELILNEPSLVTATPVVTSSIYSDERFTFDADSLAGLEGKSIGIAIYSPDATGQGPWIDDIRLNPIEDVFMTLVVNKSTGEFTMKNSSISPFDVNFYEIKSESGSLSTEWNSFSDQNLDAIGDAEGESWDEAGGSSSQHLLEAFLSGSTSFATGGDSETLAGGYTGGNGGAEDLEFFYGLTDGTLLQGIVTYETGPGFDPADLNKDGFVDGLDLGIQLGNFNQVADASGGELNGTPPVDGLDLGILLGAWSPPAASGVTAVPEPTSLVLAGLGLAGVAVAGRRR